MPKADSLTTGKNPMVAGNTFGEKEITPASTPNVLIGFQEASKEVSKRLPRRFPRGLGTNWFLGFKKLPEASRRLPRGFKRLQEASRCIILLS